MADFFSCLPDSYCGCPPKPADAATPEGLVGGLLPDCPSHNYRRTVSCPAGSRIPGRGRNG
jgi:hypothetical protein